jgi:TetR/AcrR family transcriptional regulator, repressor for neighboring sulfatase
LPRPGKTLIMTDAKAMGMQLGAKTSKRVRRSVEVSKQTILERAEYYLIAEGLNGVKVQKIARDLGLSDAAIHYHFGNRKKLLEALLRFAGRRFVAELTAAIEKSEMSSFDLASAARLLSDLFERRGTARLAMSLILSGWSPPGAGMLQPLAEWLHRARARSAHARGIAPPVLEESQKIIAVLNAVIFMQALTGDALLRSSGMRRLPREQLTSWIVTLLEKHLE